MLSGIYALSSLVRFSFEFKLRKLMCTPLSSQSSECDLNPTAHMSEGAFREVC